MALTWHAGGGWGGCPRLLTVIASLATLAAGCDQVDPERDLASVPPVAFDRAPLRIETSADTFRITVEVAATPEQKAYGLMERDSIPRDYGMLFLYPEGSEPGAGFWMFRTRMPLDIAFMDSAGRILAFEHMRPCESYDPAVCRTYSPGVQYFSALEVRPGFFERHNVGIGDRVVHLAPAGMVEPSDTLE